MERVQDGEVLRWWVHTLRWNTRTSRDFQVRNWGLRTVPSPSLTQEAGLPALGGAVVAVGLLKKDPISDSARVALVAVAVCVIFRTH